jgi:TolA-binding protein
MRFHLLGCALLASVACLAAAPASAQRNESPEKRIERLEQELRAVQRKVFPNGAGATVTPELTQQSPATDPGGVPATNALADLTGRIDALETQLRELTGQSEQNGNRLRQIEEATTRLRESTASRLDALEQARTQPAATPAADASPPPSAKPAQAERPSSKPPRRQASATPAASTIPDWVSADTATSGGSGGSGGDAEEAYNAGFRLWEQKRYSEAQKALEAVVRNYPSHRFASWAGNLAGRAYLDAGNPAAAAKALLANYQANPKGERAADSLYFLGQALLALRQPANACKAYDELQDVYGPDMRDWLKQRLPTARAEAKCR